MTEFGVGGFPILKASKKIDAAYGWAKYLTTIDPFNQQMGLGSSIPSRRSVAYDDKSHEARPQELEALTMTPSRHRTRVQCKRRLSTTSSRASSAAISA